MKTTVPGPTYREMLHPELLIRASDELDPINLFNITWRGPDRQLRHIVLPKELTGVQANMIVLVGRNFPSGSHKVGPAYTTLMEGELAALSPEDKLQPSQELKRSVIVSFPVTLDVFNQRKSVSVI